MGQDRHREAIFDTVSLEGLQRFQDQVPVAAEALPNL